jgi:hypothetical protein
VLDTNRGSLMREGRSVSDVAQSLDVKQRVPIAV